MKNIIKGEKIKIDEIKILKHTTKTYQTPNNCMKDFFLKKS
jgi:hypothetical protein